MKIKILGSGGWEGIPAPFCKCKVCKSAKNPESKDNRTRPELLVETSKGKFLIEISPDIRLQSNKFNLSEIKDFLVSHWHFDHMYGLYELHAWSEFNMGGNINIYSSKNTKEWLERGFAHIPKKIIQLSPFKTFSLHGVKITPLPVYHMGSDKEVDEDKLDNVFAYLLEENGKRIAYLSDYYKIPQKSLDLIKGVDLAVVEGTYLFENIFPNKPEQNGLKSDSDHLHGDEILGLAKSLNAKKIVFHSITHLSEKTHEELQRLLPKDMILPYDGMEFVF